MPIASTGLARITVTMLDRRLDVALPDDIAVAELVPAMVRHAGEHFVDAGAAHGGWMLRRADGAALSPEKTLIDQGVRDGDVLALVRADLTWPEPEFDDIVDAIATVRRHGQPWNAEATQLTAVAVAVAALTAGLVALAHTDASGGAVSLAAGLSAMLLGLGALASRAAGDARIGGVCGALALPYAFVAGAPLPHAVPDRLLAGSVAMTIVGLLALAGTGRVSVPLVAGIAAGAAGVAGSIVARSSSLAVASAVVIAALVLAAGLVPAVAIRITGLARWEAGGDLDRLTDVAARADDVIVGLFLGIAVTAGVSAAVVAFGGNDWAKWLGAACAGALVLRARCHTSVRQRVAAIMAGAVPAMPLIATLVWTGAARLPVAGALAAAGLLVITASMTARRAPYLSRAGDVAEAACTVSILPLLCGALGLYARLRGLT